MWLTHRANDDAFDDMFELLRNEPERGWRLIRAVVGSAHDYAVLAAIAAGPLEDLINQHRDVILPILDGEVKTNVRLRICLRAAYADLPHDVRALVEAETADVRDLPADTDAQLAGADLALVVSWLHHSDTAWASEFLKEMIESDPPAAWDVLRVLAVFADEDVRLRHEIFEDAFGRFMRRHLADYREKLVALGHKNDAFRKWVAERNAAVGDAESWTAFLARLASV
ncbi:MAG TPA: hypothetical protein VJ276_20530 [Thermoanaerobaculia bacterium]|nr:hypothetical protein [Thermoanaerobaculia bacterium]